MKKLDQLEFRLDPYLTVPGYVNTKIDGPLDRSVFDRGDAHQHALPLDWP